MSGGSSNETGQILGSAISVGGGAALLPNTGGSELAMTVALIALVAGSAVIISAIAKRAIIRFSK